MIGFFQLGETMLNNFCSGLKCEMVVKSQNRMFALLVQLSLFTELILAVE